MPQVHMIFTDTPAGGVAVHTDFQPAIGRACSPAQAAALEIYNRTRKQWGMSTPEPTTPATQPDHPNLEPQA